MPEPTKKCVDLYSSVMTRIKERCYILNKTLYPKGQSLTFFENYRNSSEFALLQLRMICELIAIACLIAHEDIPDLRSNKFKKNYSAAVILKALENLHADFYPKPMTERPHRVTGFPVVEPIKSDYLTKADLLKLYHYCDERLHAGRVGQFLTQHRQMYHESMLMESTAKIFALLNLHWIDLLDENWKIKTYMHAPWSGNIYVQVLQLTGPDIPE